MIGNVLSHIAGGVNSYVCRKQGIPLDSRKVILSNIVNPDGGLAIEAENSILLTLIDIRQDPVAPNFKQGVQESNGVSVGKNKGAIHLNLYLLFSTYFPGAVENALNHLTYVIQYFQVRHTLTRYNSPGLPEGISRLTFQLETQDFQEKGHMWGLLGGKYLPSALYKMQMLTFVDSEAEAFLPPVTGTDQSVRVQ